MDAKDDGSTQACGFAGFVGLSRLRFAPDTIEIAWRLGTTFQHRGLATEAAAVALDVGFSIFALNHIIAITSVNNIPSQAVMRRLHMRVEDFFKHPLLPPGHPLARHIRSIMTKHDWLSYRTMFPFLREKDTLSQKILES